MARGAMTNDMKGTSKTLSLWLRHAPEKGNLVLDEAGWAPVDAVLAALSRIGVGFEDLLEVVETSDKQRFELSADLDRIRARQGHSVSVDLGLEAKDPPQTLFHGTVAAAIEAIRVQGLQRMRRHHVHLSPDIETARRVGARRGAPVILTIDAAAMSAAGLTFYHSTNGVWLTDSVPPEYLSV